MIPAIVAEELKATLLDYLDTTFSFHDVEVARALQEFLGGTVERIFKGPFVSPQLPYKRVSLAGWRIFSTFPAIPALHTSDISLRASE